MVRKTDRTVVPIVPVRRNWDAITERRTGARASPKKVPPHDHPNILDRIEHLEAVMEVRFAELNKAFLKDSDGNVDVIGHNKFHLNAVDSAEIRKHLFKSAMDKIIGMIAVALVMWMGSAIWARFSTQIIAGT